MSEQQYREKADVWPLNPKGELTSWAIVETKTGLQHVREIAAVKGLAVLFPGAGTLRGVFSTVDSATKERKLDTAAWEASIQQVLAACKEFDVPCGYPANLFQQGFVGVIVQEIDLEPWHRFCSLSDVSGEVDNGSACGGIIGHG